MNSDDIKNLVIQEYTKKAQDTLRKSDAFMKDFNRVMEESSRNGKIFVRANEENLEDLNNALEEITREIRYLSDDVGSELEGLADELSKHQSDVENITKYSKLIKKDSKAGFSALKESVLDTASKWSSIITALKIGEMATNVGDIAMDSIQILRQVRESLNLSKKESKEILEPSLQIGRESLQGYGAISDAEYISSVQRSIDEWGLRNSEAIKDAAVEFTKLSEVTDASSSDFKQLVEYARINRVDTKKFYKVVNDNIKGLSSNFALSASETLETFENFNDYIRRVGFGDDEKQARLTASAQGSTAMLKEAGIKDIDKFQKAMVGIAERDPEAMGSVGLVAGGDAVRQIRDMMNKGDMTGATKALLEGMSRNQSRLNSPELMKNIASESGFSYSDILTASLSKKRDSNAFAQLEDAVSGAVEHSGGQIDKAIKDKFVPPLERLKNWFSKSGMGQAVQGFQDSLGHLIPSMTELVQFLGGLDILAKTTLGQKLLQSRLGLFIAAKVDAISDIIAAGMAKIPSMSAIGTATGGVLSTVGTTAAGWGGASLAAGSTGAMVAGGATILGAIGAVAGIGSAIKDLVDAGKLSGEEKKDKQWSAGAKFASVGSGTAIGAAIGSIIPGVGTAIGAIVGAGLGGIIGIISGSAIGKWMRESWEGTTKFVADTFINIADFFKNIFSGVMDFFKDNWGSIVEGLKTGAMAIFNFIVTPYKKLFEVSVQVAGFIKDNWDSIVDGIKTAVKSLIDFVIAPYKQLFNLSMKVVDYIKNNWDVIVKSLKTAVKAILDFIVAPYKAIFDSIKWVVEHIPGVKGVDGSHYSGLESVPYDGYIAELHKGERIVTSQDNEEFSNIMENLKMNRGRLDSISTEPIQNSKEVISILKWGFNYLGEKLDKVGKRDGVFAGYRIPKEPQPVTF